MQHANPNMMIISTQTPDDKRIQLDEVSPGKTGIVIQGLTHGGMVHMHRDKQLHGDEKQVLQDHLHSNGWLIITGHGGREEIKGEYIPTDFIERETTPVVDISCSAKDYANLCVNSGALKKGDHINILLFVCYAAEKINGKESFTQKLAQAFSEHGISSQIISSKRPVGRIGNYNEAFFDKAGEQIAFRASPEDIRVLVTMAGEQGMPANSKEFSTKERVMILADTVRPIKSMTPVEKMTDKDCLQAIETLPFKVNKIMWNHNKNLSRQQAEAKITANNDTMVFRKGSDGTSIVCSLYVHKKSEILHMLFPCALDKNNKWVADCSKRKPEEIEYISRRMNAHKASHSLGSSGQLWEVAPEKTEEVEEKRGHTPRSPKGID